MAMPNAMKKLDSFKSPARRHYTVNTEPVSQLKQKCGLLECLSPKKRLRPLSARSRPTVHETSPRPLPDLSLALKKSAPIRACVSLPASIDVSLPDSIDVAFTPETPARANPCRVVEDQIKLVPINKPSSKQQRCAVDSADVKNDSTQGSFLLPLPSTVQRSPSADRLEKKLRHLEDMSWELQESLPALANKPRISIMDL